MRSSRSLRLALLVLLSALVMPAAPPSITLAQAQPDADSPAGLRGYRVAASKHPKLDSRLVSTARTQRERGPVAAQLEAGRRGLKVLGGGVRVLIEGAPNASDVVVAAVSVVGGTVEARYADLVQALLPASALETVAAHAAVRYVRSPDDGIPEAVAGQGVARSNASAWQAAGFGGAGVKIGIIDSTFADYPARQASGDLPSSLTTVDFCSGGLTSGSGHGTAVAEIVHEMAPSAQLYLICFDTVAQLGRAKDYARSQGIQIINHSIGWLNTSRGDGSGGPNTPEGIMSDARDSGILWVNSAGNHALEHWSGTFSDPDRDDIHNFTPTDVGNTFRLAAGRTVAVNLKWDDWPASAQDFDLYLVRTSDRALVGLSDDEQSGSQRPTERIVYTNNTGVTQDFFVAIERFDAIATPRFDLVVRDAGNLQYRVPDGSLNDIASAPKSLAVGAVCWDSNDLEPYSSRGPTIDGRIKPDLVGQDRVSTATFGPAQGCGPGGFAGTSASAPHVAGAAALVKRANPTLSP